jgi:hypothetical protein
MHIDIHTGLGGRIRKHNKQYDPMTHIDSRAELAGRGGLRIITMADDEAVLERQEDIWGKRLDVLNSKKNTSASSQIHGDITNAWIIVGKDGPERAQTVCFEFGTVPPGDVFVALRNEHIAFAHGDTGKARIKACAGMRTVFAPSDALWEGEIMRHGVDAYRQGFKALRPF